MQRILKGALPAYHLMFQLAALVGLAAPGFGHAQIRTDGSVGPAQNLTGPRYQIGESLGRRAGGNLFHSFQTFNLASGESANFTTSSAGINNVISRVTGGTASQINGQISLTAASGAPNFYFINPAGITFGAGAAIDVPGAFHVSSADSVKFADGRFEADLKNGSNFSTGTPESFGFVGANRSAITLNQGALLATRARQSLTLAAGDLRIDDAAVQTSAGGNIRVAAVGSQQVEVPFAGKLPALSGDLSLARGGAIIANTGPIGDVGDVAVSAGNIRIDGMGTGKLAGITSSAGVGTSGKAGDIDISATGSLSILNGGLVASNTFSSGDSGAVRINADSIGIDGQGMATRITAAALTGSSGSAGDVEVTARGAITLSNGASIEAPTSGAGNAGTVRLSGGDIRIDGAGKSAGVTGSALPGSSGSAGQVRVVASNSLTVMDGGMIATSTFGKGDAGMVRVEAQSATLDGRANAGLTGITSSAESGSAGQAGSVEVVVAGKLSVLNGAGIASQTFAAGDAGSVQVAAGSLLVDRQGNAKGFTGVSSSAERNSGGNAGTVQVRTQGNLTLANGAEISSSAQARGNAGSVVIHSDGLLTLARGSQIASSTQDIGNAGSVNVQAANMLVDGQGVATGVTGAAVLGSTGNAGSVEVSVTGDLTLNNGGAIASPTFARGDAGAVRVTARNITISAGAGQPLTGITSSAERGSQGNGGIVAVSATQNLVLSGNAQISSTAASSGNAGSVNVTAGGDIKLSNGASIESPALSSGNAGSLSIDAGGTLAVLNGGQINSSTVGSGRAGDVLARAGNIVVAGGTDGKNSVISASASEGSSGQTGNLSLAAQSITVASGGNVAIQNSASVPDPNTLTPTLLRLDADSMFIRNAQITAASGGNVAASNIAIRYSDRLLVSAGSITSSANEGDAGTIKIEGGKVMSLDKAQVTTSVSSRRSGNGGDIDIRSENLVLRTGFIQANTAASNASGGNVRIDVQSLVPSLGSLLLGGSTALAFMPEVAGFNVIQAAAPTGLSGDIAISSPVLNISASLAALKYQVLDTGGLARSPCQTTRGSSLSLPGRGGLPRSGSSLLTAPALDAKVSARLDCAGG